MMIKPALNDLLKVVDCRYSLVTIISKRARQIVDDCVKNDIKDVKQVTAAAEDLIAGRVQWHMPKNSKQYED